MYGAVGGKLNLCRQNEKT